MRFSVPRSLSPSPERGYKPRFSSYGLTSQDYSDEEPSDSDLDSDIYDGSDAESSNSSSSSSSLDMRQTRLSRLIRPTLPPIPLTNEERAVKATVASIRKYTRDTDEYDDWKRETRESAFMTARRSEVRRLAYQDEIQRQNLEKLTDNSLRSLHDSQMAEVQQRLKSMELKRKIDEGRRQIYLNVRDTELWKRIEDGINVDSAKIQAKLDAERKIREEKERQQRQKEEEAERQRQEEEKLKAEKEWKLAEQKENERKAEEERNKAEQTIQQAKMDDLAKADALKAETTVRKSAGMRSPWDEWVEARVHLMKLKVENMRPVKSEKHLKSTWGTLRRQMVPKVGQLTDDPRAIDQISMQLYQIVVPPSSGRHPPQIYLALLSSLAKTILLQAETEVTASKHAAIPLAKVAFNLLTVMPEFADIFLSKLVQRTGPWAIPLFLPDKDFDGRSWQDKNEVEAMWGYQKGQGDERESNADYVARVTGVMRVYFEIIKISPREPLGEMFRVSRAWAWLARMIANRKLLEMGACSELIFTALDVLGFDLLQVYGQQWAKMLILIHQGVTTGYDENKFIGGDSIEGRSGRARVMMVVESILDRTS